MKSITTKHDSSQPVADTAVYLFDDWFDPIETCVRELNMREAHHELFFGDPPGIRHAGLQIVGSRSIGSVCQCVLLLGLIRYGDKNPLHQKKLGGGARYLTIVGAHGDVARKCRASRDAG